MVLPVRISSPVHRISTRMANYRLTSRGKRGRHAMTALSSDLREALAKVGTSTLTGVLNRRGLKSMTLFDVWPMRPEQPRLVGIALDRKSTRLNSSHGYISYAVFCLKKKKKKTHNPTSQYRDSK